MDKINSFRGEYYFLSNFYPAPVCYAGIRYQNNEAAYQAQKVLDEHERRQFTNLNPSQAKAKGLKVKLRPDWESVKEQAMRDIVLAKFTQNKNLRTKLITTGDVYLEEGNDWGDTTWGTVNGEGENRLGKILMDVRRILKEIDDIGAEEHRRVTDEEVHQIIVENQEKSKTPFPITEKTIMVLERENGWYGGYEYHKGEYTQVFNTNKEGLFMSMESWYSKGYTIAFVKKEYEAEFMQRRGTLKMFLEGCEVATIWRYETAGPFQMGGPRRTPIATKISIHDYKVVSLEKGFTGIVVEEGPAKGVYELTSGGLVGDTVEEVNADILACDDLEMMKNQITISAEELHNATMVTNERFGLKVR